MRRTLAEFGLPIEKAEYYSSFNFLAEYLEKFRSTEVYYYYYYYYYYSIQLLLLLFYSIIIIIIIIIIVYSATVAR